VRVVIDPNVLVSAAVTTGVSARLIDRWLTERPFEIVTCPHPIGELREVLGRDKFRRWLPAIDAHLFVDRIDAESDSRPDPADVPPVTGDPKDDYLVALYRACEADLLVSGDDDLTSLDETDVTVLTPAEMLDELGEQPG
jgi:uncharacterized protein